MLVICNFLRPDSGASAPCWQRYVPIDPETTWKQSWDAFVMLFLMYTTFSVPYMLAFGSDRDPREPLGAFDIYDICLDTLFCIDIVLSFFTAYTMNGVYERSLGLIVVHYLRTWFFLDFFGSVPFDKIVTAVVGSGQDFGTTLKIMKIARILKMVRAVRFLNKLKKLEEKVGACVALFIPFLPRTCNSKEAIGNTLFPKLSRLNCVFGTILYQIPAKS